MPKPKRAEPNIAKVKKHAKGVAKAHTRAICAYVLRGIDAKLRKELRKLERGLYLQYDSDDAREIVEDLYRHALENPDDVKSEQPRETARASLRRR